MHFGAFYLSSWRQNDWIWGRLDGSRALIRLLVKPEWLLARATPAEAARKLSPLVPPAERDAFTGLATQLLQNVSSAPDPAAAEVAASAAQDFLTAEIAKQEAYSILSRMSSRPSDSGFTSTSPKAPTSPRRTPSSWPFRPWARGHA